jgi:hypothetical protein
VIVAVKSRYRSCAVCDDLEGAALVLLFLPLPAMAQGVLAVRIAPPRSPVSADG